MNGTSAVARSVEYHVLKHGEMFGPFTAEDLRAGLADGHFELRDFVQVEGQVVWQPLGRILEASEEELRGAVAPDWACILKWAWLRVRYNLDEQGALAGVTCLVLGTLSLALSNWPFIFWVPWFGAAAVAAIALFRRKREAAGGLILLAVLTVPWLFHFFGPKAALQKGERMAETPAIAVERPVAPEPKRIPAPPSASTPAPALVDNAPGPIPGLAVEPAAPAPPVEPASPVSTPASAAAPAPVAVATIAPHYAPAPEEPPGAMAPAATPASASIFSTAKNLAGAVVPFLVDKASSSSSPAWLKDPKAAEQEAAAAEADLLRSHNDAFVIVKGSNGSGSGFVCRQGDKTWLFSNIHVVSEIKQPVITRLDGVALSVGSAEIAAGPDIARMTLATAPEHPLEVISDFEANVHIGDEIVVLGNSGGGGVVTSLKGKVVGIGPDRLEVSAEFIPGNSGSPIVHLKSGKVIGIATYLTRRYEQFNSSGSSGSVVVRRFGYRIDKVPAWEPINWGELYAEADQLEQISKLTEDIFDFGEALRSGKDPTFATEALRRPAQDWASKLRAKNMSGTDRLNATQSFLNALRFMVKGDVANARAQFRYTYFRNRLTSEERIRDRLYQAFDAELAKLNSPLSRRSYR